eukprot:ANDGO_03570.mRNA.1 hypothetical protein
MDVTTLAVSVLPETRGKQFAFSITLEGADKPVLLAASTKAERDEWIDVIERVQRRHSNILLARARRDSRANSSLREHPLKRYSAVDAEADAMVASLERGVPQSPFEYVAYSHAEDFSSLRADVWSARLVDSIRRFALCVFERQWIMYRKMLRSKCSFYWKDAQMKVATPSSYTSEENPMCGADELDADEREIYCIQIVGTYSGVTDTFCWSWGNEVLMGAYLSDTTGLLSPDAKADVMRRKRSFTSDPLVVAKYMAEVLSAYESTPPEFFFPMCKAFTNTHVFGLVLGSFLMHHASVSTDLVVREEFSVSDLCGVLRIPYSDTEMAAVPLPALPADFSAAPASAMAPSSTATAPLNELLILVYPSSPENAYLYSMDYKNVDNLMLQQVIIAFFVEFGSDPVFLRHIDAVSMVKCYLEGHGLDCSVQPSVIEASKHGCKQMRVLFTDSGKFKSIEVSTMED